MGHPCCNILDCQEHLRSVKDQFCPKHQGLIQQCCITTCTAAIEPEFRTCSDLKHRNLELYQYQKGKAMFQLKNRLQRSRGLPDSLPDIPVSSPSRLPQSSSETDATAADLLPVQFDIEEPWELNALRPNLADAEEEIELDSADAQFEGCDGKSAKGNRVVRARFGRKRTHNEELCVYSCGIVAGRATFFGSEAPNGVRVSCLSLFTLEQI
jgi:hypothetical protein